MRSLFRWGISAIAFAVLAGFPASASRGDDRPAAPAERTADARIVEEVVTALQRRESAILDGGFEATYLLKEVNPRQAVIEADGSRGEFGHARGAVTSEVAYFAHGPKWRMNLSVIETEDERKVYVPGETTLEFASDGERYMEYRREYRQGGLVWRPTIARHSSHRT